MASAEKHIYSTHIVKFFGFVSAKQKIKSKVKPAMQS